jgi:guanylate kinase
MLEHALLQHTGNVFVLSAPSGAGKSTLANRLVQEIPGLVFSISTTTRAPRAGEVHGRDYFFVDDATFDAMVAQDGFIEWVEVYGRRYGTGKNWIMEKLSQGVDILLDIETKGAQNVRKAIPDAEMVFLLPPSAEELARRLRGRGKDSEEQIRTRLQYARHEMEQYSNYDYIVVNDDLETAYRTLVSIIFTTRARRARMVGIADRILKEFV